MGSITVCSSSTATVSLVLPVLDSSGRALNLQGIPSFSTFVFPWKGTERGGEACPHWVQARGALAKGQQNICRGCL